MTQFSRFILLLAILTAVLVGVSSCGGSGSDNGVNTKSANTSNAAPASSEYPPLAQAVAQSDLKNLDGSTFKVADRKGKVLLLNMWATWCGPCRSEMPALVRMQNAFGPNGFEVIGINTDDEPLDMINDFAAEMKLNYTLVWGDTQLQNSLLKISKFPGIPQSFLIDREGNLRGVFRGANPADIKKMEDLVGRTVSGV